MDLPQNRVKRSRILVVVASAMTVRAFLIEYLKALAEKHYVVLVCSGDDAQLVDDLPSGVEFFPIEISRDIKLAKDISALVKLVQLMRSQHFDMLHSVTPKAGLLSQIAARWSGIAVRMHTFTGQVWATKKGAFRLFLKTLDRLLSACTTHLLADSASQRDFLIAEGIAKSNKIGVLGQGSVSGVDEKRFRRDPEIRLQIRNQLGFREDDILALFVGRINRDKGVLDLAAGFAKASKRVPKLALLLVGPDEANLKAEIDSLTENNSRVSLLGLTFSSGVVYGGSRFLLSSKLSRGFRVGSHRGCGLRFAGNSLSNLWTDGRCRRWRHGVLHPAGDIGAISALLERFSVDVAWRLQLGRQARERVLSSFTTESIVRFQLDYVNSVLGPENDKTRI